MGGECPVVTPPEQQAEAEEGTRCRAPALPAGDLRDLETLAGFATQRTGGGFHSFQCPH